MRLTDGRDGYIKFVDKSKNEYWVEISGKGTEKVKEPYTVKVPFEDVKK